MLAQQVRTYRDYKGFTESVFTKDPTEGLLSTDYRGYPELVFTKDPTTDYRGFPELVSYRDYRGDPCSNTAGMMYVNLTQASFHLGGCYQIHTRIKKIAPSPGPLKASTWKAATTQTVIMMGMRALIMSQAKEDSQ